MLLAWVVTARLTPEAAVQQSLRVGVEHFKNS